jgi:periplasmic protein CpxP/Spy
MKKLIVLALLIAGTTMIAQERNRKGPENKMEQFTPEQRSQLMLKKMTLDLDLTDAQQKDMSALITDKMAKIEAHKTEMKAMKEKGVQPTNDEKFAMAMKRLDEQIATKKSMQKILNAKQFERWTSLKEDRDENRQGKKQGGRQGKHQGKPERKG